MIKKITIGIILFFSVTNIFAQEEHVFWKHNVKQIDADIYEISMTALIDDGWHIYDTLRTELGPNPTIVNFDVLPDKHNKLGAVKVGETEVIGNLSKMYDDVFMMEIGYYENSVTFVRKFKLTDKTASVKVRAEWMSCDYQNCFPLSDTEMIISLPGSVAAKTAKRSNSKR